MCLCVCMHAVSQDSELPFQFGAEDAYEVIMRFETEQLSQPPASEGCCLWPFFSATVALDSCAKFRSLWK